MTRSVRTLTRSFAGGEITPELFGRLDLTKFQTGLQRCENMIVLPHGPITKRPGFEHVIQTKYGPNDANNQTRLIPFQYNTEQTYILEFGHLYLRVHTQGATVLAAAQSLTSISNTNPAVVTYTGADPANGAWVYISGVSGMTLMNGRFVKVANVNAGANTFEAQDLQTGNIDATGGPAGTGGTMAPVYEIASPYSAADLAVLKFEQSADVLSIAHPSYALRTLSRTSATTFVFASPTTTPSIASPTAPSVVATGSGGTPKTHTYSVTSVSADGEESLPISAGSASLDLTVAGNYVTVDWTASAGALYCNVYKTTGGSTGFIGRAGAGGPFVDDNIVPDYTRVFPQEDYTLVTAGYYPGAVSYHEQRKVVGGSATLPNAFYASVLGTEYNFTQRKVPQDDDRIKVRLVARQVNEIRHFVPLSDLLLLTSGGEWIVSSAGGAGLSPTSIQVRPQSYHGCSHVRPVVTGNAVLYVQAGGRRLMVVSYTDDQKAYVSTDASIMAPHLVDDHEIVDMAFTVSPDQVAWALRDDGRLLGLTFVPEHDVAAWHQHTTSGTVESVAVVQEGADYTLYATVSRTIGGRDVRFVERMRSRHFTALEDWFGVDCGETYSGAATAVISGLWHLEGQEVAILADGATVPRQTVAGGSITLSTAASVVHIGLPYSADIRTLPLTHERLDAGGLGQVKNVSRVHVRVHKSSGLVAGVDADHARTYPQRTNEPYGSPPSMLSEEIEIPVDGPWCSCGELYFSNTDVLPLTLASMSAEVEVGD